MKYTEILNRRLKKAGREYRTGNHSDKKERLWNAIQEIMEEAEGTGSFLPWTQAVQKLKLNEQQQMLIAVLWGTETYGDRLSVEEFRRLWIQIYEEEPENMKDLPVWYYFNEEYVELCPGLSGWLGRHHAGASIGSAAQAYGRKEILWTGRTSCRKSQDLFPGRADR